MLKLLEGVTLLGQVVSCAKARRQLTKLVIGRDNFGKQIFFIRILLKRH